MTLPAVRLDLLIGSVLPRPAPLDLTQALLSAEVTQTDEGPSGFQLSFHDERRSPLGDYPLVRHPLLAAGNRVILTVTLKGTPRVLMDGFITRQELTPSGERGGTVFTVTGEDVSVKMDMFEISLEYPYMTDYLIANSILARYAALGLVPTVVPTPGGNIPPGDSVPQQNQTDRSYLRQLASRHGYSFYVTPGPVPGLSFGYWGPPLRIGAPQKTLTADMGPLSNVGSVTFSYDSLAPAFTYGMALELKVPLPILLPGSTRAPALASHPPLGDLVSVLTDPLGALTNLLSTNVRGNLFQHQGMDYLKALDLAQARIDISVDEVVTARGQVETARYGDALKAPGLVTMRGAGREYDGLYYVKRVSHKMVTRTGSWDYKQDFMLTREGLGATV